MASTALYQIWAGTKQKELGAGSMQVIVSLALTAQQLWPDTCRLLGPPAHSNWWQTSCSFGSHTLLHGQAGLRLCHSSRSACTTPGSCEPNRVVTCWGLARSC